MSKVPVSKLIPDEKELYHARQFRLLYAEQTKYIQMIKDLNYAYSMTKNAIFLMTAKQVKDKLDKAYVEQRMHHDIVIENIKKIADENGVTIEDIEKQIDDHFNTIPKELQKELTKEMKEYDKAIKRSPCNFCKNPDSRNKCARCEKAYYCNKECQTSDWKNHKKTCC